MLELQAQGRDFAIVFRTFGLDLEDTVLQEFNAFCTGKHPLFPTARFDGTTPPNIVSKVQSMVEAFGGRLWGGHRRERGLAKRRESTTGWRGRWWLLCRAGRVPSGLARRVEVIGSSVGGLSVGALFTFAAGVCSCHHARHGHTAGRNASPAACRVLK